MEDENEIGEYYGRFLMLFEFDVTTDLSEKWSHRQTSYEVGLFAWAS